MSRPATREIAENCGSGQNRHHELYPKSLTSVNHWQNRMGHALRYLDDLSKLNQSPLARLTYVERLAKNEYYGCILPRGQALRQLLLVCIEQVMSDGSEEPCLLKACQYLQLRRNGYGCQQISAEMGLSREHVSRHYRKQALDLVLESFLHRIENGV